MSAPGPLRARFDRWLSHPRLPLHLALLAVVLCLPALDVGWQLDDNFHRVVLLGGPASDAGPLEMFAVLRGRPELHEEYVDAGIFPWWISPSFHIAFLRPLSAATAWLDYELWPRSAPAQHAHSLLWLGAVVFAAVVLYRRLEGRGAVAGLAALLFAVDDAHGTAAGWLANRNALVATLFAVLCLYFHDRWRRGGRRPDGVVAPVCLALALAAGELALGAVGFLVAHAIFLDQESGGQSGGRRGSTSATWRRVGALVPSGLVLAIWAAIYRLGGFGARGSGLYVDPVGDPLGWAAAVAQRLPLFLAGQLTPLAADLGALAPRSWQGPLWWIALALVAGIAAVLAPMVRRRPTARFWALGSLLAVLPLCATFPSNRVLWLPGLGAMALVSRWLVERPRGRLRTAMTVFLIATHLVLAPLLLPVTARVMKTFGAPIERSVLTLPHDPWLARQDLVIVNAPDYLTYLSQAPALLALEGRPLPRRLRGLAIGPSAVTARRIDGFTLELTMTEGFLSGPLGELYRPAAESLPPGSTIAIPGMSALVVAILSDGRPATMRFRFDNGLDDDALRWVAFEHGRFVPFTPPEAGVIRHLPAAGGPFDALLTTAPR